MGETSIEWVQNEDGTPGRTWNPLRGCSRISPGCGGAAGEGGCYAEQIAARFSGEGEAFEGFARRGPQGGRWTGRVGVLHDKLMEPLRWRKPSRVFANSMSDLFHEALTFEEIDKVVSVMLISSLHETRGGHTFITLTKRSKRLRDYANEAPARADAIALAGARRMEDGDGWYDSLYSWVKSNGITHPLLWFGVSVENQKYAEERVPDLLAAKVAVRMLSCEPLLGDLDLNKAAWGEGKPRPPLDVQARQVADPNMVGDWFGAAEGFHPLRALSWVVVGGESGRGARAFDLAWARRIRDDCARAGVAYFFKQGGLYPIVDKESDLAGRKMKMYRRGLGERICLRLVDSHGGDLAELPEDLRVREWPKAVSS